MLASHLAICHRVLAGICILAVGALQQLSFAKDGAVKSLAFVITDEAKLPDAANFATKLQARLGSSQTVSSADGDGEAAVVQLAGGTLVLGAIPRRIPNNELDTACRSAWWRWDRACEVANSHRGHFIVSLIGDQLDQLDSALVVTQAAAVLLELTQSTAVYWHSNLVSREQFLKASAVAQRQNPPVPLWVELRVSKEPSGNPSISTAGMSNFGLMEIESKDARISFVSLLSLVNGMAQYLIKSGPVIRDGDTVGEASQKIRVRHGESYWRPGMTVYRVEF
jgi:hypothetical protein